MDSGHWLISPHMYGQPRKKEVGGEGWTDAALVPGGGNFPGEVTGTLWLWVRSQWGICGGQDISPAEEGDGEFPLEGAEGAPRPDEPEAPDQIRIWGAAVWVNPELWLNTDQGDWGDSGRWIFTACR